MSQHCIWVCLLLVIGGSAGWSDSNEQPGPTVDLGYSTLWGEGYELVLRDGTYQDPVSRLIWPVAPSLAINLRTEWPWTRWTSTRVSLSGVWLAAKGTMVDEDWDTSTLEYARSHHEAYLKAHWTSTIEQGFHRGHTSLWAGLLYRWTSWEGWDGSGYYKELDGDELNIDFSGLLIAYRQEWIIPYLGGSVTWAGDGLIVTPSARFSPFASSFNVDNHNYAGSATTTFLDNVTGGLYGQAALELLLPDDYGLFWGIRFEWELAWGAIGDTTQTTSVQTADAVYPRSSNSAGAWFHERAITIFIRQ